MTWSPQAGRGGLFERWLADSHVIDAVEVGDDGVVVGCNRHFAARRRLDPENLVGAAAVELFAAADAEKLLELGRTLADGLTEVALLNVLDATDNPVSLRCLVTRRAGRLAIVGEPVAPAEQELSSALLELNNELSVLNRENARIARELAAAKQELERALADLRASYWHLRKLQEVMPVCMECGRVKTGEARWDAVIDYLKQNQIFLSHGYCPECAVVVSRRFGLEEDAP